MSDKTFEQGAKSLLDSLLEGCQVVSFDWRYVYVNDAVAAQARTTKEALLGHTMMECFPGIEQTPMFVHLRACMEQRKPSRLENEFRYPDGSQGWFELRFIPVAEGTCVLSFDISEVKRTAAALARSQEQLFLLQKMEAVSRLAGGVAHDFNNLLAVILSYSKLASADLKDGDPLKDDLHEIHLAGQRAAALTRQLLTFSRQQMLEPRLLNLNEIVAGMEKMFRRILGEDIQLSFEAGENLHRVRVDAGQIEQVLMNLVVNARDAMPTGGKLTLETTNLDLDEAYARSHLGVNPGPYVLLAVSDTGVGMDKETQARIFEPFFTTKAKGSRMGLGLSTVFGIARQSGGSAWVYSEPGKGSCFKVYLPKADELAAVAVSPAREVLELRGTETVLLVEDEEQVRQAARTVLQRYGYHVLVAKDAGEAIWLSEKHSGRVDLLLSDVVMPDMSGVELARRLCAMRDEMRVLCMSGYSDQAVVNHGLVGSDMAFVQKPFTPELLVRRVRQVLEAPTPLSKS